MKKVLLPKEAEKIQNEIFRKMSIKKKLRIASQLILLAKKLRKAKEITRKK
jgi:hypothetical protein